MAQSFRVLYKSLKLEPSKGVLNNVLDAIETHIRNGMIPDGEQKTLLKNILDNRDAYLADRDQIPPVLHGVLNSLHELDPQETSYVDSQMANRLAMIYERNSPFPHPQPAGGAKRKTQAQRFCKCIKSVRKTLKARRGSTKEKGAIAVCTKSVLQTRGRTLKRFKCGKKPRVLTQKRK